MDKLHCENANHLASYFKVLGENLLPTLHMNNDSRELLAGLCANITSRLVALGTEETEDNSLQNYMTGEESDEVYVAVVSSLIRLVGEELLLQGYRMHISSPDWLNNPSKVTIVRTVKRVLEEWEF